MWLMIESTGYVLAQGMLLLRLQRHGSSQHPKKKLG